MFIALSNNSCDGRYLIKSGCWSAGKHRLKCGVECGDSVDDDTEDTAMGCLPRLELFPSFSEAADLGWHEVRSAMIEIGK